MWRKRRTGVVVCCPGTGQAGSDVSLFDIENKPLEVFAFWVVYVYRMVGRLVELVEYAHISLCLSVVICGMLPFSVPFSLTLMLSFRSVIGRISPSQ